MARTAAETANTLISIYDENFANDSYNQFRINWPELRSIAGVAKLTDEYLHDINQALNEGSYVLIPLDNFLVVALEQDFSHVRPVSPRIVEQYLPGDNDDDELEFDDDDDDDLDDSDEFETMDDETDDTEAESADAVNTGKWVPKFRTRKAAIQQQEETE